MTAPNVLLVTVDCLRRDRLSAYGHQRSTTPTIDGLLGRALHASFAHAAASWTAPSVVALMTGRYPTSAGGGLLVGPQPHSLSRTELPTALPPDVPILPDVLGARSRAAFLGVWNADLPFPGRLGKTQVRERSGSDLVRRALAWIRSCDEPWFCWVHLREPHDPLLVDRGRREVFGSVGSYPMTRKWSFTGRNDDLSTDAFATYREERERLYDASVLQADAAIAELLQGVGERCLTVISADHGEELWEHREEEISSFADPRGVAGVGHGHAMWQEILAVPLVIAGASVEAGEVATPTSLIDVVPTIADLAGVPRPSDIDGCSLIDPQPASRIVRAEGIAYGNDQRVAVGAAHKLYRSPADDYERLFALDPVTHLEGEAVDDAALAAPLAAALDAAESGPAPDGVPVEMTAEIEEHLRSLGYLG